MKNITYVCHMKHNIMYIRYKNRAEMINNIIMRPNQHFRKVVSIKEVKTKHGTFIDLAWYPIINQRV